jgi:glutathione S-transferase
MLDSAFNPLGKVPVLLRPGQTPLFDSGIICAYFDRLHEGRKLIPAEGEARWQALRQPQKSAERRKLLRWAAGCTVK